MKKLALPALIVLVLVVLAIGGFAWWNNYQSHLPGTCGQNLELRLVASTARETPAGPAPAGLCWMPAATSILSESDFDRGVIRKIRPAAFDVLLADDGASTLTHRAGAAPWGVKSARVDENVANDGTTVAVLVEMDDSGAEQLRRLTGQQIGRDLAVCVAGRVVMAPRIAISVPAADRTLAITLGRVSQPGTPAAAAELSRLRQQAQHLQEKLMGKDDIFDACRDAKVERIASLISQDVQLVNRRDPDHFGYTPLHWAAEADSKESAEFLLSHGAALSETDDSGDTPLHIAAAMGKARAVTLLVEKKAPLEAVDKDGLTPLLLAAEFGGGKEVATILLDHGARVDARGKAGDTVLHWAAIQGNRELATLCLDHHADVNALDSDGRSPLHAAAASGSVDMIRLLLDHNASLSAKTKTGQTPLRLATIAGHSEAVEFLKQKGASE